MTADDRSPRSTALDGGTLRHLTKHNDACRPSCSWRRPRTSPSKSKDGTEVHGLIVKPAGYEAGTQVPDHAATSTAGRTGRTSTPSTSTASCSRPTATSCWRSTIAAAPAAAAAYQKAIHGDWGNLEVVDLLGAVDEAVRQGIADPNRLGIGGWSYGGISTNYTIATDPRFKAAVSGAGSLDAVHDVRRRPVHHPVRPGDGAAVEGEGQVDEGVVSRSSTPTRSRRRRCSWAARRTSTCPLPAASRCTRRSRAWASTRSW